MAELDILMKERAMALARYLDSHFEEKSSLPHGHQALVDSTRYSILQEGSKRFRPVLAMLVANALDESYEKVLPFAASVECIHTYSLVHDDLPAMDDDDFRRGQPTNHKIYGEATAILAGDALLTEAFAIIAGEYEGEPDLAVRAIGLLARASGLYGMVGGQAIDMGSKKESISLADLKTMHSLKTGALIRVSAVGAAVLCRAPIERIKEIETYADHLGLAFQVADDLLDYDPAKPEPGSYPALLGSEKTRAFLAELTEAALDALKGWSNAAEPLREIARYNRDRQM